MEKFFHLKENGTKVSTEIIAGLTTFFAMSYIIVVNPGILAQSGMEWGAVFLATIISAIVGTLVMGLVANVPYAQAPGMGLNAFFVYTVCFGLGFTWQQALSMVFICGLLNIIITVTKVRKYIIKAIPLSLQHAIGGGIGIFVAYIGFLIDNRNILLILLILSFLLSLLTIFVVAEGGIPTVSARSSTLYEPITDSFVFEKDATRRLPMASTTKIMTALIALERCNLDEVVTIPSEATGIEGSSIYLKAGDEISVRDLVYSVLLQSANDAATALAILISGDISSFADVMNGRAAVLGLTDTHYENPHGLDSPEHYTTARDLALLAAAALKNDEFKKITSTYKHSFCLSGGTRTVINHNKLLKRYDGCIGVKTGYTDKSGRCLVSAVERDGVQLISVTLDAPDDWNDHKKLYDYGFTLFETVPLTELNELDFELSVSGGEKETLCASVKEKQAMLVHKKSTALLTATLNIKDTITAPVTQGDTVGELTVYCGDKALYSFPITADEAINKKEKPNIFFDILNELF